MPLIDIGVNLMHRSFNGDREGVVRAAEAAGVSPLIITGTSAAGSRAAADYAAKYPGKLYATAGVHPHEAKNCGPADLDTIRRLARQDPVVALGECGLDYNRDFSPRPVQREWFEKQLELARELGLPLFLHERDAFDDFSAMLKAAGASGSDTASGPDTPEIPPMVVHCFTGAERELAAYLELGCYIGVTGWICDERRGKHLLSLVKAVPPDRLMIETDAPFLIPRDLGAPGNRGRSGRNEPRYLTHIAAFIARTLGKDPEQLAAETFANTQRFFRKIRSA